MPIVRNFIRHTSPARLQQYFAHKNIAVRGVDWSQDQAEVARNVIPLVGHLSDGDQARLRVDAERVCHMADEIGQAALLSVVKNQATFTSLQNGIERSHWAYVSEPESFRHAEDIRYADDRRRWRAVKWIPQGWQWVDPQKEFSAMLTAIRSGLMSRSEAISAFGYDAEDIDREIAVDNARADELGLIFDSDPRYGKSGTTGAQ